MKYRDSFDYLANLPYFVIPVFLIVAGFLMKKIKYWRFGKSLKTPCMRELWEIYLNLGIDGDICIEEWKNSNAQLMGKYFSKSRVEQVLEPLFIDAGMILKQINNNDKRKNSLVPVAVILDEIISGKPMQIDQIVDKYLAK